MDKEWTKNGQRMDKNEQKRTAKFGNISIWTKLHQMGIVGKNWQ